MIKYKTCGTCKKELPKTLDYFFVKTTKQKLASGKIAIYKGFRSNCKKCHAVKGGERRVRKRCKELDCNVSDYRENWKKQYSKTRTIDLFAKKELTEGQYNVYKSYLKKGIVFNLEEHKEMVYINKHSKPWLRKFDYGGKIFLDNKETRIKSNRNKIDNITDSYIVNYLGYRKNEVPIEIIQSKRLLIKLKRELNITNYEKQ
tara:strand:+ start:65 stop:670 length:606 start_codon:yes stop_codon:yes gene_type:complete